MTARRSLRAGILAKVAAHAGIAVGTGLISIVVGRVLGPTGAGAYAVAVTYLAALVVISRSASSPASRTSSARAAGRPRRAFAATQVLALGVGVIGAARRVRRLRARSRTRSRGVNETNMLIALVALPFALTWMLGCAVPLALDRYEAHACADRRPGPAAASR